MGTKRRKGSPLSDGTSTPAAPELPERWSLQRKTELVVRLLRGEPLDAVARDSQVPAHELEEWRRVVLDGGTQGLKKRVDPEERELKRVQAKLGEVMMRLELAEGLIEKKEYGGGWGKPGGGRRPTAPPPGGGIRSRWGARCSACRGRRSTHRPRSPSTTRRANG